MKLRTGLIGLVMAVLMLAACGGEDEETVQIGLHFLPKLNIPWDEPFSQTDLVFSNVFDTLVEMDQSGALQPGLAESWESVDELTWEFKLRSNLEWSNGDKLTAEDVKFSAEKLVGENRPRAFRLTSIDRVQVIDDRTLRIITTAPDPVLARRLQYLHVLPKEYFLEVGEDKFLEEPVSSGAFTIESFSAGARYNLEANKDYWGGRPRVDRIVLEHIPDASARTAALRAGDVDIISFVPSEVADDLKRDGFQVLNVPQVLVSTFFLDSVNPGPLQDKRVRQALSYAIDRDSIVKNIFGGYATVSRGIFDKISFGNDPNASPDAYDPAKARQLLEEAGFSDGFTIAMQTSLELNPKDRDIAIAVQDMLRKVGVKVELEVMEQAPYFEVWGDWLGDSPETATHAPMFGTAIHTAPSLDLADRLTWWANCGQISTYCNKQAETLFQQQATEMDSSTRLRLLQDIGTIVNQEVGGIFIAVPDDLYAANQDVDGIVGMPTNWFRFKDVALSR